MKMKTIVKEAREGIVSASVDGYENGDTSSLGHPPHTLKKIVIEVIFDNKELAKTFIEHVLTFLAETNPTTPPIEIEERTGYDKAHTNNGNA